MQKRSHETLHNTATKAVGPTIVDLLTVFCPNHETIVVVKKSNYPLDIPSAENGLSKVMCSLETEWMWERRETQREVPTHGAHEEPFPKGTGMVRRPKIQPVSGISAHRIMHLSLIRCGR